MSILDEIIAVKHQEVAALSKSYSLENLRDRCRSLEVNAGHSFFDALVKAQAPAIIAEVKKASPSKGIIRPDLDPVSTAVSYSKAGASCLSVLTDEQFFKGSNDFLIQIKQKLGNDCPPVLRKDFMIDPLQIWESKLIGANAVLLIVAALDAKQLHSLALTAKDAELDVLIEIHKQEELELVSEVFGADDSIGKFLLGINNRDLHTFNTDLSVTKSLAKSALEMFNSERILIVSESGIFRADDAAYLYDNGAQALLIGESLVAKGDPGENLNKLIQDFRNLRS